MPNSRDSLRSAGSSGLKGRIARVWPATGAAVPALALETKDYAIAAIATSALPAPGADSPIRLRRSGRCAGGDAALVSAVVGGAGSSRRVTLATNR